MALAAISKRSSYEAAIFQLNALQSNASIIQSMRKKREVFPERNILETERFLEQCLIQVDNLDSLKVIHISGTKGKGSTCAFVESMLRRLGYRTGFYSSPHLVHVRERIRINGIPLTENEFARYFFTIFKRLRRNAPTDDDTMPAYFKFLTLMAYHVFIEEKVDVAIVEVGIGGEYDCTNVIRKPIVCAVTTLDYDHTSILGQTLREIAWHKAGIFKPGAIAVTSSDQSVETMEILRNRAIERHCDLRLAPLLESYQFPNSTVQSGIPGLHQSLNISLALQIVRLWLDRTGIVDENFPPSPIACDDHLEGFPISRTVMEALRSCQWPGRSQVLQRGLLTFYLDGAHTPKSMQCCAIWFNDERRRALLRRPAKSVLLFHCTADRQPEHLLGYLQSCEFDYAIFCPTKVHRTVDRGSDQTNLNQDETEQSEKCETNRTAWIVLQTKKITGTTGHTEVFLCIEEALDWLQSRQNDDALDILVTGSLHLVGGVIGILDPILSLK